MNGDSWLVLMLLALLSGCRVGSTGADTRRYPCTQDEECVTGFTCRAGSCQVPLPLEDAGGSPSNPGDGGSNPGDGGSNPGDAGEPDGGGVPTPVKLGFTTTAQSLVAGVCSPAITVDTQTSSGTSLPVSSEVTVTLSAQPAAGTTFYRDTTCTAAITSATVAPGSSRITFYVRATAAPSVRLFATAPAFASTQQDEAVRAAAPAGLAFVSGAQSLDVGECSSRVDLELRDTFQNPSPPSSARGVALAGTGVVFYSDVTCDTALTEVTFTPGSSRASFYFRSRPSGTVRVTASATGLVTATQDETVRPLQTSVRFGSCELLNTATSVSCPISPPQTDTAKTMMFVQVTPEAPYASYASVRCVLSSVSAITCTRYQAPGGSYPRVPIVWRTVEMATGLKVQHLQPRCTTSGTLLSTTLPTAVVPANTFLLVSSEGYGNNYEGDDFFTAKLTGSMKVDLQFSLACNSTWRGAVQVVEMKGARVTRDVATLPTNDTSASSGSLSPVDLNTSALLFTYRVSNTGSNRLCDRVLRGELASSTSVAFSRGAEGSNCATTKIDEIAWERIDFGPLAQVQNKLLDFPIGSRTPSPAPTLTSVDLSRTVAFSSAQAIGGQSGGETTYADDRYTFIGESMAALTFASSTSLQGLKLSGYTDGRLRMNVSVVQFEP